MTFSSRLKERQQHGTLGMSVLYRLRKLGIDVTPYLLFEEAVSGQPRLEQDDRLTYEVIEESKVEQIVDEFPDENRIWKKTWYRRLSDGEFGLLARIDGEVAGFGWANMKACTRPSGKFLFAVEDGQCYLHDMVVAKKFRGMKLAPMIREAQFGMLVERGITEGLSFSKYFNKPAIRFKQKLNARVREMRCELILFRRFEYDFRVRRYAD